MEQHKMRNNMENNIYNSTVNINNDQINSKEDYFTYLINVEKKELWDIEYEEMKRQEMFKANRERLDRAERAENKSCNYEAKKIKAKNDFFIDYKESYGQDFDTKCLETGADYSISPNNWTLIIIATFITWVCMYGMASYLLDTNVTPFTGVLSFIIGFISFFTALGAASEQFSYKEINYVVMRGKARLLLKENYDLYYILNNNGELKL